MFSRNLEKYNDETSARFGNIYRVGNYYRVYGLNWKISNWGKEIFLVTDFKSSN